MILLGCSNRKRLCSVPQEYSERCSVADRHRLLGLFETWHLASLASASSSAAAIRGFESRRGVAILAGSFRAWASLLRARRWRRIRRLRQGFESLASFAASSAESWPRRFYRAGTGAQDAIYTQRGLVRWGEEGAFREREEDRPGKRALMAGQKRQRQRYGGQGAGGSDLSRLSSAVSLASAHRRWVALSKGLRALRLCATAALRSERFIANPPQNGGAIVGFSARSARSALAAWRVSAAMRRRARARCASAEDGYKRRCLVLSLRAWACLTAVEARQKRADRAHKLKASFVSLRQVRFGGKGGVV